VVIGRLGPSDQDRAPHAAAYCRQPTGRSEIARHEILARRGTYSELAEAVADINAGERPLALYYFGTDAERRCRTTRCRGCRSTSPCDLALHDVRRLGGVGARAWPLPRP
jgi:coniferyl-aldehyde dehydrogenase